MYARGEERIESYDRREERRKDEEIKTCSGDEVIKRDRDKGRIEGRRRRLYEREEEDRMLG